MAGDLPSKHTSYNAKKFTGGDLHERHSSADTHRALLGLRLLGGSIRQGSHIGHYQRVDQRPHRLLRATNLLRRFARLGGNSHCAHSQKFFRQMSGSHFRRPAKENSDEIEISGVYFAHRAGLFRLR